MNVDAIVLAAGSSTRFGSDKRLYMFDGVPMLQRSLRALSSVPLLRCVHVVLRDSDAAQLPLLLGELVADARVLPLLLPQPELGMGSNLARAVQQLPMDVGAVLIALADMPFVRAETVTSLCEQTAHDRIVVPVCRKADGAMQRGHPVLFGRQFFSELLSSQGDAGARAVLQAHGTSVREVFVRDEGVWRDIDVPQSVP